MNRIGLSVYLVLLISSILVIVMRVSGGFPLETNILALLPETEELEWVARAEAVEQSEGTNRLVILIGNPDFETARSAAEMLTTSLVDAKVLERTGRLSPSAAVKNLSAALFPYRTGLLSEGDRKLLAVDKEQVVINRALVQILSPLSLVDADLIRRDPFLLLPNFMAARQNVETKLQSRANVLAVEDNNIWYVLVSGKLIGEPFDQVVQSRTLSAFEAAEERLKTQFKGLKILKAGAVFYGERAYHQAEQEASFIGGISLLGIVVLNFLIFRSFQPLALSILAIASGVAGGLAMTLLFFGTLHLLALVFGAGLIGVAVDYSFHYVCERFQENVPPPAARAAAIRSGLTLGLVSSVLGFLTLALTPFPGLQQIALFSASGLTLAYLTVLYVFPYVDRAKPFTHGGSILSFSMVLHDFWWQTGYRKLRWVIVVLVIFAALYGATKIHIDDDVRRLQSLPADLQGEEQSIRTLTGIESETHRFFVRGPSSEDVLQTEEALGLDLEALRANGVIRGYRMISQFIPSVERQQENRALVNKTLIPHLAEHMARIGLSGYIPYQHGDQMLTLDQLAVTDIPSFLAPLLVYKTPGVVVHAVSLTGVKDSAPLAALAAKSENIELVNQAESLSRTFGTYRLKALIMLAVAYGVVWVFLSLRYGPFGAVKAMLPSIGAVVLTPPLIALTGETFTFFNAMSLMLVFAIGLDYAVFNRESIGNRKRRAMLANGLSAISTLLAFGLLAMSDTYAIHAFGFTILVGITLAYCLAPLASDLNHDTTDPL
ncbi:MMPL family transporter [Sneathiella sp.]|uniref:MMPL family transporter n=1 Tax=Sneathiella sp. TaxID=1964365 RepID=UPI003566571D